MKTLATKLPAMMTFVAVFLLTVVGISAQSFEDDVYYTPSKDAKKKKEQPKVVRKEYKNAYQLRKKKVDDFESAQEKYAKMLRENETDKDTAYTPTEGTANWVYETQGLESKKKINEEVSLYTKSNVKIYVDDEDEEEYVLWQPSAVTQVSVYPRYSSRWYFSNHFVWGSYYNPYHTFYFDPYWDYDYYGYNSYWHRPYRYYSYWNNPYYYNPWAYGYGHYYGSYYGYPYYGGGYYNYGHYYGNPYYGTGYYRPRNYGQRPQEAYTQGYRATERRDVVRPRRTGNSAEMQRVAANAYTAGYQGSGRRYSGDITRQSTQNGELGRELPHSGLRKAGETIDRNASTNNSYPTRRASNTMFQGKAPYTRTLEDNRQTIRRASDTPTRGSVGATSYRRASSTSDRQSINTNYNQRRSAPTIYRTTTSGRSSYRSGSSSPSRSTYVNPRSATRRSSAPTYRNTSSPSRSSYSPPSSSRRATVNTPSRSNSRSSYSMPSRSSSSPSRSMPSRSSIESRGRR